MREGSLAGNWLLAVSRSGAGAAAEEQASITRLGGGEPRPALSEKGASPARKPPGLSTCLGCPGVSLGAEGPAKGRESPGRGKGAAAAAVHAAAAAVHAAAAAAAPCSR